MSPLFAGNIVEIVVPASTQADYFHTELVQPLHRPGIFRRWVFQPLHRRNICRWFVANTSNRLFCYLFRPLHRRNEVEKIQPLHRLNEVSEMAERLPFTDCCSLSRLCSKSKFCRSCRAHCNFVETTRGPRRWSMPDIFYFNIKQKLIKKGR
ncbi:hypothetical protein TNCV_3070541 [Trichonephila clavipes]|nr:hypothetical protein TNCV_3070541 [Trichonephila clavipes]